MSIDNADLKDIKDLPSAGTPTRTMSLASQQASVSDIAQRTTVADLALDGNPINASDVDYRFITPKDFNDGLATTSNEGIIKKADDAAITAGSEASALTADMQGELFSNNIRQGGHLDEDDLDSVNTGAKSNLSAINIISFNLGQARILNGSFALAPTNSVYNLEILFSNARQPTFTQGTGVVYTAASAGTKQLSGNMTIAAVGGEVNGIGQVKLTFGTDDSGTQWNNATTYTIAFSITYQAKF